MDAGCPSENQSWDPLGGQRVDARAYYYCKVGEGYDRRHIRVECVLPRTQRTRSKSTDVEA